MRGNIISTLHLLKLKQRPSMKLHKISKGPVLLCCDDVGKEGWITPFTGKSTTLFFMPRCCSTNQQNNQVDTTPTLQQTQFYHYYHCLKEIMLLKDSLCLKKKRCTLTKRLDTFQAVYLSEPHPGAHWPCVSPAQRWQVRKCFRRVTSSIILILGNPAFLLTVLEILIPNCKVTPSATHTLATQLMLISLEACLRSQDTPSSTSCAVLMLTGTFYVFISLILTPAWGCSRTTPVVTVEQVSKLTPPPHWAALVAASRVACIHRTYSQPSQPHHDKLL